MKKKILAISGSTKKQSSHLNIIRQFSILSQDLFEVTIFEGVDSLPHFNPDLDIEPAIESVNNFRKLLKESNAVLICTPEYAMGVPGSLKNAIDWTVSSSDFSHKPVALITASSVGQKGHAALLETLRVIECDIPEETQLLIPFIKTKINNEGIFIDPATLEQVKKLIESFHHIILQKEAIAN